VLADLLLLPDTNLFIQCKPLEELNWVETFPGYQHIRLLISRPVQVEIDRQKNVGSGRIGKRARGASSQFRRMVLNDDNELVIRQSNPRVTMFLTNSVRADPSLADVLDYDERDDELVGIAASCSQTFRLADVALLTYDTGPILSAKTVGIQWIEIPADWLLAPEQSDDKKTIQKLRAQVAALQASGPIVDFKCTSPDGSSASHFNLSTRYYRPLADTEISELMLQVTSARPMATDFGQTSRAERQTINIRQPKLSSTQIFTPASDAEKQQYTLRDYPNWVASVRQFLTDLHLTENEHHDHPVLHLVLENIGSEPARDTLLIVRTKGAILVRPYLPSDIDDRPSKCLPAAPEPPRGRWSQAGQKTIVLPKRKRVGEKDRSSSSPQPLLAQANASATLDRNRFEYRAGRPLSFVSSFELECPQWRHGKTTEILEVELAAADATSAGGAIEIEVHAENLRHVQTFLVPIRLKVEESDVLERAQGLTRALDR